MATVGAYFLTLMLAVGRAQTPSGEGAASGELALRLSAESTSLRVGERPSVRVTITNNGGDAVTLVHPGDGSDVGWRTPHVAWSVIGANSEAEHRPEPAPHSGTRMCGNINSLKPDELFYLAPGETKELKGWASLEPFGEPGVYRVVYLYANRPALEWKGIPLGEHDESTMWFVRRSTQCTLSSNELVFSVSG